MAGKPGRSGRKTKQQERDFEGLINKCYKHLFDKFQNFSEKNQTMIALEIIKKAMPSKLQHGGEVKGGGTKIVIIQDQKGIQAYQERSEIDNRVDAKL